MLPSSETRSSFVKVALDKLDLTSTRWQRRIGVEDNVDAAFFQVLDHRRKISFQEWLIDTLHDRAAQDRQLRDELLEFV